MLHGTALYQTGIVVDARADRIRIEFIRSGSCGGCANDQGCGLGPILALLRPTRPQSVELDSRSLEFELNVGDTVRLVLAGHQLLKIVGLAYLLPILGMFIGAWLAAKTIAGAPDISAVAGALTGLLFVSWLLARAGIVQAGGYLHGAQIQAHTSARAGDP